MRLIRNFSTSSFSMGLLLGLMLFTLGLDLFSDNKDTVDESFEAKRKLAIGLLSRVAVGDVQTHKDTSVMHGPRYFYFQTRDVNHLVEWLRLKQHKKIPRLYEELVKRVQSEVEWPFNWGTQNVYAIYYCNLPQSNEFAADMLLVDGNKVVYMIDGVPSNLEDLHEEPCEQFIDANGHNSAANLAK